MVNTTGGCWNERRRMSNRRIGKTKKKKRHYSVQKGNLHRESPFVISKSFKCSHRAHNTSILTNHIAVSFRIYRSLIYTNSKMILKLVCILLLVSLGNASTPKPPYPLTPPPHPPSLHSRSVINTPHYALITPDSLVHASPPPTVNGPATSAAVITPALGAHFTLHLLSLSSNATIPSTSFSHERLFYLLTGSGLIHNSSQSSASLLPGGFVYIPPFSSTISLSFTIPSTALLLSRPHLGPPFPPVVVGHEDQVDVEQVPGEDFILRRLLPIDDDTFDFNIHVMDFAPGQFLHVNEVHYNQHALVMLAGAGIYRLSERYMPVTAGDIIYMAPFTPQWYAALGPTPTRYWLYKDTRTAAATSPMDGLSSNSVHNSYCASSSSKCNKSSPSSN